MHFIAWLYALSREEAAPLLAAHLPTLCEAQSFCLVKRS